MTTITAAQTGNLAFKGLKSLNYRKAGLKAKEIAIQKSIDIKNKPNLSSIEKFILKFFPKSNLAYKISGFKATSIAKQSLITKA